MWEHSDVLFTIIYRKVGAFASMRVAPRVNLVTRPGNTYDVYSRFFAFLGGPVSTGFYIN